jgi:molecular chaperone DnaK
MLKDTGDKLGSSDKAAIEAAMDGVKKAIEGSDANAIQKALDALTAAQHKAAEALYKSQAAQGSSGSSGSQGSSGSEGSSGSQGSRGSEKAGDVIDAEVVDDKS